MVPNSNNNFSAIPFYTNIEEQNHRRSYAYGAIYPLYAQANTLLPFQILRKSRINDIAFVRIITLDGSSTLDITPQIISAGLTIYKSDGWDVILYPAFFKMPIDIKPGKYYISISDGEDTWYSDIITLIDDTSGLLEIKWWDEKNLVTDSGVVVYENTGFKNRVYLCTELGKPEYPFEEEGETRDGYFFPEKQISEKTYRFTILAPEYLCDAMRIIRLSDFVEITDSFGRKYNVDSFLMTPEWQTQGDLASVEVEFQTNTVVKKIGRISTPRKGDFNSDFNNDYNIQ